MAQYFSQTLPEPIEGIILHHYVQEYNSSQQKVKPRNKASITRSQVDKSPEIIDEWQKSK